MRFNELFEDFETWTGHWILPDGEILTVDHSKDLHHVELAFNWFLENDQNAIDVLLDAYDSEDEAINDDYFRDQLMDLAINDDGWIRTMIRDTEFAADLPPNPTSRQKRRLQRMLKEHSDYDHFMFNDASASFSDVRKAMQFVGQA